MIKKIIFLSLILLVTQTYAMEKECKKSTTTSNTTTIRVRTPKKTIEFKDITPETTIAVLKKKVEEKNGISPNVQSLVAVSSTWFGLKENPSTTLRDSISVMDAMQQYNTTLFNMGLRCGTNLPEFLHATRKLSDIDTSKKKKDISLKS